MELPLNSADEILKRLEAGEFERLVGVEETAWLDAKKSPYILEEADQKRELAKDVTALANANGGLILIGFETSQDAQTSGERIKNVCLFSLERVDSDQYRKVLADWVYPPLDDTEVRRFPDPTDASRGIAAVLVKPAPLSLRPVLVKKILDENDRVVGTMFGYYERRQDRVSPTSVERLHQLIQGGQHFSVIEGRLLQVEDAVTSLVKAWRGAPTQAAPGIPIDVCRRRLKHARIAAQRDDLPILYFMASAQSECSFPTLFESRAEKLVRLLENPPKLREHGFGLWAGESSAIVTGRLRRTVAPGYKLLELWPDGLLTFVGPGDEDLLAWKMRGGAGEPIRINNFVLAETVLLFCWLVRLIFSEAQPRPLRLRLEVGFDNMAIDGKPSLLSNTPLVGMSFFEPAPAPDTTVSVYQTANWDDYDGCGLPTCSSPTSTTGSVTMPLQYRMSTAQVVSLRSRPRISWVSRGLRRCRCEV